MPPSPASSAVDGGSPPDDPLAPELEPLVSPPELEAGSPPLLAPDRVPCDVPFGDTDSPDPLPQLTNPAQMPIPATI
jgi:hypothetical protein